MYYYCFDAAGSCISASVPALARQVVIGAVSCFPQSYDLRHGFDKLNRFVLDLVNLVSS